MTWSLVASFWQPAQAEDDSSFIFLNNLRIQTVFFLFTLFIMSYFDILLQKLDVLFTLFIMSYLTILFQKLDIHLPILLYNL